MLRVAHPGQQRPVLLFAAVHDFVLRHPDVALARYYRSVTPASRLATDDPWPTFRATCLENRDELESIIATHTTQTNEVNRVVLIAALLGAAIQDVPDRPVSFVELGTSAGLLLGFASYRVALGAHVLGDQSSPVHVAGEIRSGQPPLLHAWPTLVDRVGIDIAPMALDDRDAMRWLEACLWPDQPWRIDRFRAAVATMRATPPSIVSGDFIDVLPTVLDNLDADTHVTVFHSWALTYVARARRPEVAAALAACARDGREVSWISAEPPRCVPGIDPPRSLRSIEEATQATVLGLRRWRHGVERPPITLGLAHHHGDWLEWGPQ